MLRILIIPPREGDCLCELTAILYPKVYYCCQVNFSKARNNMCFRGCIILEHESHEFHKPKVAQLNDHADRYLLIAYE